MATKTPTDPKDGIHGEEEVKPLFGPGAEDPSKTILEKPTFREDDPGEDALAEKEAAGGVGSRGAVGKESGIADQLGKGFTGAAATGAISAATPAGAGLKSASQLITFLRKNKRKAAAGGGIFAGFMIGVVFIFSVLQGPFQFIHMAQLLQQFHMQSNEDFSAERGFRSMVYALTGKGQRTRLGIPGNYAADKWEKKLLEETGLRPVYSKLTRQIVGFEIVDKDKAFDHFLDIPEDSKGSAGIDRALGKGAEIRKASEVSGGQEAVRANGERLPSDTDMIDISGQNYRERGKLISTINSTVNSKFKASVVASRLMKKRAGVSFHPLRNLLYKGVDKLVDWRYDQRRKVADEYKEGAKDGKVKAKDTEDTDDDKKPDTPSQADQAAADGAEEAVKEVEEKLSDKAARETTKTAVKGVMSKIGGGAAAVGILCAAKGIGDSVPDYKYANIVLPMLRMGMGAITMGNQIMSGNDVSVDELGAMSGFLYDPATKTHWNDAKTIQGELGHKQTGPGTPPEARLSGANDKPQFFDILDAIPFLGTACTISNIPSTLPIIGDVINFGADAVISGVNVAASAFGTSVDKIMEGALAMISGNSVDTMSQGADYGNLANTGAFLAGNDNAISMGGSPLTNAETAELRAYENENLSDKNQTKSFAQRYLDPYAATSLTGRLIDDTDPSVANVASFFTSSLKMFTGGFSRLLPFGSNPAVSAASNVDYGVPKFGFSLADQENSKFENPYDNAEIIEDKAHDGKLLNDLNDKYGKPCFGMTVTAGDDGIQIETEEMGSDDLNVFKVMGKDECNPQKNKDPMFKRYRFYLADAVTIAGNACWQADGDPEGEKYCNMMGYEDSSSSTEDVGATETPSDTIDMDHLYDSSVSIACAPHTKDLGIQDGYHDNNKVKIRVCAVSNAPSSSSESSGDYGVSGANGKLIVNSRISQVIYDMVEDAKKDGVAIGADSGFRTMAHQQCLYAHTCGSNTAAAPGTSNHQMGLAVDWQSPMYTWLANGNGSKWGFKALVGGEPWHWSPTGN